MQEECKELFDGDLFSESIIETLEQIKEERPWFYLSCLLQHDMSTMANDFIQQKIAEEGLTDQ